MAKFFKQLFTTTNGNGEKKKNSKTKNDIPVVVEENKEFSAPYDTKRKLSISRSGRMKQNLKVRGTLGNDLFGQQPIHIEKTNFEYHVHGKKYSEDIKSLSFDNMDKIDEIESKIVEINLYSSHNNLNRKDKEKNDEKRKSIEDMDAEIESAFKIVETSF